MLWLSGPKVGCFTNPPLCHFHKRCQFCGATFWSLKMPHFLSLWLCWSVSVLPSTHSSIIFTKDVMIFGEYSLPSCIYMKHCNALFCTVISSLILWPFTPHWHEESLTWLLQRENYLVAHNIFKIQHQGWNTETSNKYLPNNCVNSSLTLTHSLVPHTSLTTLYLIQSKGKQKRKP